MISSYNKTKLDYSDIFTTICFINRPKEIVEIGILEGFSLKAIANSSPDANIRAYDIFDDFNGNGAKNDIIKQFPKDVYKNISIEYGNFFELTFPEKSIDLLHIDIANDGDVYEYVFENYIQYVKHNGMIILEGGSEERDNVEWMNKYNKTKIQPILEKYRQNKNYEIITLDKFPSITLVKILSNSNNDNWNINNYFC